jgi:hypothetical protein
VFRAALDFVAKMPARQTRVVVLVNVVIGELLLLALQRADLRQDMQVRNLQNEKGIAACHPVFAVADRGVDALGMDVGFNCGATRERCSEDRRRITVSVEGSLQVQVKVRDLRRDAPPKLAKIKALRRRNKAGRPAVHDCSDHMQCLHDRALASVIPADDDRALMKCDRVIAKATIILETKRAQHESLQLGAAPGP